MKRILSLLLVLSLGIGVCLACTACQTKHTSPTSWTGKYTYDNAKNYTAGVGNYATGEVKNLDIDWGAGEVSIMATEDVSEITLSETVYTTDKNETPKVVDKAEVLYRWLDGDTLRIRFLESKKSTQTVESKTLVVKIPAGYTLGEVKVESDAANVTMGEMTLDKIDLESIAGDLFVDYCSADTMHFESESGDVICGQGNVRVLDAESTSGKVYIEKFEGLDTLKVQTVSGNIRLWHGTTLPGKTEVDSTSGEVKLMFPTGSAFTVVYNTTSGNYSLSGFEETVEGNTHRVGGGGPVYDVETVSGNLIVTRMLDN